MIPFIVVYHGVSCCIFVKSWYEKAFGLDTSVNPYAVEIENLFDTTRDRNQKLTINAYRRKYGEKLSTDDPEAIEEAERLLNNGFTGEVV